MSTFLSTTPGELGELAAEAIEQIVSRAIGHVNISAYIEGEPPIAWSALAEAGWDRAGVDDGDGEAATTRDLTAIAYAWGQNLVQLPLLPTIVAKRHSAEAAGHEGPVTLSIPRSSLPAGWGSVPFAGFEGVTLLADDVSDELGDVPAGTDDPFDHALRLRSVPVVSVLSAALRAELAAVWAAEGAGVARRAVVDAVEFVKDRQQFGRPVGSFQAVKHHLADAHINAEQAETAAIWASLEPERAIRTSVHGLGRAIRAVELALQVHGGLGFTWEMGVHFRLRHLQTLRELVEALAHG